MNDIKQKKLDFLGSKAFIEYLKESDLTPEVHNKIFCAHIVAIGMQCTGISEGGVTLEYCIINNDVFLTAQPNYYFYTTKLGLIENNNRTTRSNIKVKNYNGFSNDFKNPITFRDFLNTYQENSKILEEKKFPEKFTIKCKKSKEIDSMYNNLIREIPEVDSFLNYHFFQTELKFKSNIITKNKI